MSTSPGAIYSIRVLEVVGLTDAVSFVCPAGYVLVLRDLDAYCDQLSATNLYLRGNAGQTIFYWNGSGAENPAIGQWRGRQVFFPTEGGDVYATSPTDVTLSGYLLAGSPPPVLP